MLPWQPVTVLLLSALAVGALGQLSTLYEGSPCKLGDGSRGECIQLTKCPSALAQFKKDRRNFRPKRCGFKGFVEVICCADVPMRRAEEACRNFGNEINLNPDVYIINGADALPGEFPHMVALGYRSSEAGRPLTWDCGGSLISNEHVLTAAHCVTNAFRGRPVRVRLGAHNLTEPSGEERGVLAVTVHPAYKTRSHYHDLAVVRIERVRFSERVRPACLYTKPAAPDVGMVATGWGVTDIDQLDQTSEVLMKALMDQVALPRCNASFARSMSSRLARGVQPEQLCARGSNGVADTCLGDSGGPLQVLEKDKDLYSIVGVTSFGQLCGGLGVYVRVASYLDWIENIVWPSSS